MKVGAVVANLAPSKSGMVAAWLGVPVRTLLVTVGNRADSFVQTRSVQSC